MNKEERVGNLENQRYQAEKSISTTEDQIVELNAATLALEDDLKSLVLEEEEMNRPSVDAQLYEFRHSAGGAMK